MVKAVPLIILGIRVNKHNSLQNDLEPKKKKKRDIKTFTYLDTEIILHEMYL